MLQPARTKFRKAHKGRIKVNKRSIFKFVTWIQALEPERVIRQLEGKSRFNKAYAKKRRVWLRIFPNIPVSKNQSR